MGFKSKLGVGVMTGVLGLSLIGGGTYAAFNDVEEVNNTFAAGTLDLAVGESSTMDFNISNLKPGDHFKKKLVFDNNGSLDINQILASASVEDGSWEDLNELNLDDGGNTLNEFLSQFEVNVFNDDGKSIGSGTLNQVVNYTSPESPFDLTRTGDKAVGLPSSKQTSYDVVVTFLEKDKTFKDSRYQVQNKFQGEGAKINVDFEATQMGPDDRSNDGNDVVDSEQ